MWTRAGVRGSGGGGQEALLDRLEELEDIEDLKKIRHEPTRPLEDVLSDLGLDGSV